MTDVPSPSAPPVAVTTVEVIPGGEVHGSLRPPGSKSLTNRALLCAAFAHGSSSPGGLATGRGDHAGGGTSSATSTLSGALRSEDTEVMIDALATIGGRISSSRGGTFLQVHGVDMNSIDRGGEHSLFIANSGTTVRFLVAALSAAGGRYRLHGVDRMHARPIGDLVQAIAAVIDGSITTESDGGCPPVRIASNGWNGSTLRVGGSVSSQYLSGLMMAAPLCGRDIAIEVGGDLVSRPYVEMTASVMRDFGADVTITDPAADRVVVHIGPSAYRPTDYAIEPDASAASYLWAAAAITGGSVTVEGLRLDALQGDVAFVEVLGRMGCTLSNDTHGITVRGSGRPLRGIDVDMNAISDTVQTLAVVALFADSPTRVRGVAHNRFKETDRIGDLACELRKLGGTVEEHDDGLTIHPLPVGSGVPAGEVTLQTYHDHRMAMSLSLVGLRLPGVRISDPACTSKTYPEFFADLERLTKRPHRWSTVR